MMVNDKPLPEDEKSVRTNDFFNSLPWVEDAALWGQKDYWASPFEMLGRNGGDCEDFSIGKYFTLRELGVGDASQAHYLCSSFEATSSTHGVGLPEARV